MAASNARKTTKSTAKSTAKSRTSTRTSAKKKKIDARQAEQDSALFHEIGLIALFAAMVILFCCNFGIIGPVGNAISGVLFGLFGLSAYVFPVLLFLAVAFWFANEGNPNALRKLVAGIVLFIMLGIVCELLTDNAAAMEEYNAMLLYGSCSEEKTGGGILMGSLSFLLLNYLGTIGTILMVLLCSVVSLILLTEKSLLGSVKKGGERVREISREDAERRKEYAQIRRENAEIRREQARIRRQEQEEQRAEGRRQKEEERRLKEEERRLKEEEKENEKILRMEKKVSGVIMDTALPRPQETSGSDDMHEIMIQEEEMDAGLPARAFPAADIDFDEMQIRSVHQVMIDEEPEENRDMPDVWASEHEEAQEKIWERELPEMSIRIHKEGAEEGFADTTQEPESTSEFMEGFDEQAFIQEPMEEDNDVPEPIAESMESFGKPESGLMKASAGQRPVANPKEPANPKADAAVQADTAKIKAPKKYMFPPISLLQKSAPATGDSARELKETALHLQQTLATFGVKVTITDISQGPSVTRYELQPEQGVKVSKIVGLTDDIKLNLAATDIRIEAPIPGKAAVGIEVPNKENMPVALRDLLETAEFKNFPSNIAFAVGKDIGGKVVVSDIAKMPHMLIAGATGSGKSVCINTLIMSILYKANPDDVKLIMVDPKVVELSVYNGIPHLLIPVVTDPKKASAALHWGVAEMEDRYRKFADYNVRDLKGYNKKIESMKEGGNGEELKKLPQIVIIVDELADLMMVCPGEVEESICRLAQLARAAGIHLIIATQRPSVDVITGLIKANMPSRAAFSVSSGVDSRTILDMVGAEKLLGKGDMLFYPQGYSKPARVQGAFVSDKEVSDVVDFLKNQSIGNTYASDIEERIKNMNSQSGGGSSSAGGSDVDELFERAGRFIIDKDKASIGALQRALKIGFNRAARIMDQLCQYGVVSEEEGTKPRKILMGPEQFEQLLEEEI